MNKEYRCICGKVFDNPQKFNGHKTHCKEHILNKYGDKFDQYFEHWLSRCEQGGQTMCCKSAIQKQEKINQWISEQHTCEKCGKVMTEKYGSGRFCSRRCANSHSRTQESKNNVQIKLKKLFNDPSSSVQENYRLRLELRLEQYSKNPNHCQVCGAELDYNHRKNKTCSDVCYRALLSQLTKESVEKHGGHLSKTYGNNKYGTYKGFHYDSSWELAYVVYCLDHNIQIERCTEKFPYYFNDALHYYHPDFIVNGNIYTEIKNYKNDKVIAKQEQFPKNYKYQILYWDDIKDIYEYVVDKYGKNFYDTLYDDNYPNFKLKTKNTHLP